MNISENTVEIGSKVFFHELIKKYAPELRKHLVDQICVPYGGLVSKRQLSRLIGERDIHNSNVLMLRLTHPLDWFDLVDVLPTVVLENEMRQKNIFFSNASNLNKHIYNILLPKLNGHLKQYKKELSLVLVPKIDCSIYFVTEHPNEDNSYFIDEKVFGELGEREYVNVLHNEVYRFSGGHKEGNHHDVFVNVASTLRSILEKYSNDSSKYQYEFGVTKHGEVFLFQVKKFSKSFPKLDKSIVEHFNLYNSRIMGNFPKKDKEFHMFQSYNVNDIIQLNNFPFENMIFKVDKLHEMLGSFGKTGNFPKNYKGLLSGRNGALFHRLTGPVQAVLKNDGFAILSDGINGYLPNMPKRKKGESLEDVPCNLIIQQDTMHFERVGTK